MSRLEFCLSMLDESTTSDNFKFKEIYNYVHIDEKWFYMTQKDQTYYLVNGEYDPNNSCQSKDFINSHVLSSHNPSEIYFIDLETTNALFQLRLCLAFDLRSRKLCGRF